MTVPVAAEGVSVLSDGQAVQDAGGVHEPLDGVVGGGLEGLGDLLVHHEVHGVGLAEPVHRGQCFDGAGQVVDHLEGHDEVVGADGDAGRRGRGSRR